MKNNQGIFEAIYKALNLEQKKAVDHIEGPVMVIAGPGTGKTQIIAGRIANILTRTDAQAENILCLTFTDAGAVNMRKRLVAFIGTEAYKVGIHTFHSFCNLVIQENKDFFDHLDLAAASELEKYESVKYILDHLIVNDPLKRIKGLIYMDTVSLLKLFQTMKREHLTGENLLKRIDDYIKYMYESPDFRYKRKFGHYNIGDLKQTDIAANLKKLERIKSAINLFDLYNARLKDIQRYDFDDMILWVLDLFEKTPNVLSRYQEKFLYVLVDEFQDTNMAQNQILNHLTAFWDAPNLFAVGDDDQAIYRFQGADLSNIIRYQQQYADYICNISLTENYRSSQSILDAASVVIDFNEDRLVKKLPNLSKKLTAANPELKELSNRPIIIKYTDPYAETVAIAHQIENLLNQKIDHKEIAVIYRKHKQAECLIKYFFEKKIPYNLLKRSNILEFPVVIKLLTILEYLVSEIRIPFSGQNLLFKILHFEEFEIDALCIAKLSQYFNQNKSTWREGLQKLKEEIPDFLQKGELLQKIIIASDFLESWIKESQNSTVAILFEKIISDGGFLTNALIGGDRYETLEALKTLFSFVKEETDRRKNLTMFDLLETFGEMVSYQINIPLENYFANNNGVSLMTAHGSKGLEFEYVFIIDCNKDDWEKEIERSNFSLSLLFPRISPENMIEDNRRLFYVALTRAKKFLQVSYHEQNEKGKDLSPARFVVELENSGYAKVETAMVTNEERIKFMSCFVQNKSQPKIDLIDDNILSSILNDYSLSATHLNSYLRCPLSFYFNQILKVPAAKNENMGFGSVVHGTLEFIIKKKNETGIYPDTAEVIQSLEYNMLRQRGSFTEASFRRFMDYGKDIIPKYYSYWLEDWKKTKEVLSEKRILRAVAYDIPINGILDKIIIENGKVTVVDYKTGKYTHAKLKLKPPDYNKPSTAFESQFGGDYWRQIMFYKILLDSDDTHNWNMIRGEIDFIEPENDMFFKIEIDITPDHLATVKNQMTETFSNIKSHKFRIGCGVDTCEWCNFVKQHSSKFQSMEKMSWMS
jgi:DNA helicase-2/ATP-dependent DNA helicase PcrA